MKQRKAAKKAAAEAAAAEAEAAVEEEQPVKKKKNKKAAVEEEEQLEEQQPVKKKKNKKVAADEEEQAEEQPAKKNKKKKEVTEETAEPTEEEIADAKKAAKAAAAAAAAEETEEVVETPKSKKNKGTADKSEEAEEPVKKKQKNDEGADTKNSEPESFRLFVGGIAWSVDADQLRKDFEECGAAADVKLLMDRDTGNSRGIAFITMTDKKGFDAALAYDGEEYAGRKLNVSVATSNGEKGKGKGKGKDGKGKGKGKTKTKPEGCTSVVVKGLSYEVTEEDLTKCFKACGDGPTNVKVLMDKETGQSRGMAFVDFDDTNAVDEAMKLSETNLKGRCFYTDYSVPKESSW